MQEYSPADKKLIALVSNSAWSLYNFRLDIIRYLKTIHRVMVIAPDDEYSILLEQEGCIYMPIRFNNRTENPFKDYDLYYQLKKIYREQKPDFIFHYVIKPNIYGSFAASALSIQSVAVVTGLGYSFAKHNWLNRVVRLLYKKALRDVREIWFLNNEDAGIFIKGSIVNIEKTKVLPGEGINTDYFSPDSIQVGRSNSDFTFLMSARLLRSKGIAVFADAARIIRKKNYSANFELIGFFEKKHPDSITDEELKKWEREGIIIYKGFAKDVRPFLKNADCFVFPSFYNEGIPRSLLEAASMELPILTSRNRGCKEVVSDGFNGYLCNLNDPFDLADKMERIIRLPEEERKKMGSNGRELAIEKFNINRVIEEYKGTLKFLQKDNS